MAAPPSGPCTQPPSIKPALAAASGDLAGYFDLLLQPAASGSNNLDLHKARERLVKHLRHNGGCFVSSAAAAQSSMLTHLLLQLQQKTSQEEPRGSPLVAAAYGQSPAGKQQQALPGGSHAARYKAAAVLAAEVLVTHSSDGGIQQSTVCPAAEPFKLWATVLPLGTLLGLLATTSTAFTTEPAAGVAAAAECAAFLQWSCDSTTSSML